MITAIAVLLALQTLEAMPVKGLELVAEAPFPERFNRTVFGAILAQATRTLLSLWFQCWTEVTAASR